MLALLYFAIAAPVLVVGFILLKAIIPVAPYVLIPAVLVGLSKKDAEEEEE